MLREQTADHHPCIKGSITDVLEDIQHASLLHAIFYGIVSGHQNK
jgi:dTDP-4-dehydrorhamnose 3,5-epimerase-like enzyme